MLVAAAGTGASGGPEGPVLSPRADKAQQPEQGAEAEEESKRKMD